MFGSIVSLILPALVPAFADGARGLISGREAIAPIINPISGLLNEGQQ